MAGFLSKISLKIHPQAFCAFCFISIHFKKSILTIFNSLIRGLIFIFNTLSHVFYYFLILPLKFLANLFFKLTILNIYKIYLKIKKKTKKEKTERGSLLVNILANKQTVHFLIILVSLIVVVNNLQTKAVLAEDLGKGSLIFELAKGDEFSEIKENALLPITGHDQDGGNILEKIGAKINPATNHQITNQNTTTPSTTQGSIFDSSITRHTQIVAKKTQVDNLLTKQKNNILADALLKTLSPETQELPKPRDEIITYTVQVGDTISNIAKKFGISTNTVLWENNISGLSIIRPGDKLRILPVSGVSHKVAKNETLSAIAKKYSVDVDKILEYNNLASANQLQIGQQLIIPGGSIQPPKHAVRNIASVFSNSGAVNSSTRRINGFIWPTVSKHITQYYHWRHHAIDIGSPMGLPIYASMGGKVIRAGWGKGYGNHVVIDHGGGKKTLYAHMSKIYAKLGQTVVQGQAIGAIGSTGWSTGPHLHFEIIINGRKVNPLSYL